MLVKFYGELQEKYEDVTLEAYTIQEIMCLLKLRYEQEFVDYVLTTKIAYVVQKDEEIVILSPEVILSDLSTFDTLHILPDVNGDFTAAGVVAAIGAVAGAAAAAAVPSLVASGIAFALNIGLSIALSYLMSKLSPTPSMDRDPAMVQASQRQDSQQNTSNLFSSSTIVREQGGPVPLIYGNPYHGGVLIASGLFTEDK